MSYQTKYSVPDGFSHFPLKAFQQEVLEEVEILKLWEEPSPPRWGVLPGNNSLNQWLWRIKAMLPKAKPMTTEEAEERLFKLGEAKKVLKNPTLKDLLCPALLSVSNDVFEISKTLTPILVAGLIYCRKENRPGMSCAMHRNP